MLVWYEVYWFRYMNENNVSRSRFDRRDFCSTSVLGSRMCYEVETFLFTNFSKEEVGFNLHGKACDVLFAQEMCSSCFH